MAKPPSGIEAARSKWQYRGVKRPAFAIAPQGNQESVWDYPRPPRLAPDSREVVVRAGDIEIARTTHAIRVLETAAPPTFYLPSTAIQMAYLRPDNGESLCEWKGTARYWSVVTPAGTLPRAAWSYPTPFPEFADIKDYLSFYPRLLECFVDGERVLPQPGRFYGGWVTSDIVGPFKGEPGSEAW